MTPPITESGAASGVPPVQVGCMAISAGMFFYHHSRDFQHLWNDVPWLKDASNGVQDLAGKAVEVATDGIKDGVSLAKEGVSAAANLGSKAEDLGSSAVSAGKSALNYIGL